MRQSITDFKKSSASVGFFCRDETLRSDELSLLTLITDMELDFLKNPWSGSKLIVVHGQTATVVEDRRQVKTPSDIQKVASKFRELLYDVGADQYACLVNLDATPDLPGSLGPLFGFQVLLSAFGSMDTLELRTRYYDASSGDLEYRSDLESAMKTKWQMVLKEPIEKFLSRLFIPYRSSSVSGV